MNARDQIDLAWETHHLYRPGRRCGRLAPRDRIRLAGEQNWRCCHCGDRMEGQGSDLKAPTFEHIIPRSVCRSTELENIVIACFECNNTRGDAPLEYAS